MTEPLDTSAEQTRARERVSQRDRVVTIGDLEDLAPAIGEQCDRACSTWRQFWGRLHVLAVLRSREP